MAVINGIKIACDRIEIVCFDVDIIAKLPKEMLFCEPEVLLNGWKF